MLVVSAQYRSGTGTYRCVYRDGIAYSVCFVLRNVRDIQDEMRHLDHTSEIIVWTEFGRKLLRIINSFPSTDYLMKYTNHNLNHILSMENVIIL